MDFQEFEQQVSGGKLYGVMVSQNGRLLGKKTWGSDCRRNVYSAAKSITACAVGFAIQEGLLTLEEPLTSAFAQDLPQMVSDNLAKATVRDLLTMCLGQERAEMMAAQRAKYPEQNWVKLSLSFPFVYEPGTHFVYNNVGPYLAGVLVQRRAGCNLVDYLMPRLFSPLGISRPDWGTDPLGNTFGSSDLLMSLEEFHQFGLFCLQTGRWEGKQLLHADWMLECTKKQVENNKDSYGYGYCFWGGPNDTFRAEGKWGQLSLVDRSKQAVITVMGDCRQSDQIQALNRAVIHCLYFQLT